MFLNTYLLMLDWQVQRKWSGFANPDRAETYKNIICNYLKIENTVFNIQYSIFNIQLIIRTDKGCRICQTKTCGFLCGIILN